MDREAKKNVSLVMRGGIQKRTNNITNDGRRRREREE